MRALTAVLTHLEIRAAWLAWSIAIAPESEEGQEPPRPRRARFALAA
jgi:hypothetical protein